MNNEIGEIFVSAINNFTSAAKFINKGFDDFEKIIDIDPTFDNRVEPVRRAVMDYQEKFTIFYQKYLEDTLPPETFEFIIKLTQKEI